MSDKTWYIAAENDADMQDWYNALHQVLDQQRTDANADKQSISSIDDLDNMQGRDTRPSDKISGRQAPFLTQKPFNGAHSDSK